MLIIQSFPPGSLVPIIPPAFMDIYLLTDGGNASYGSVIPSVADSVYFSIEGGGVAIVLYRTNIVKSNLDTSNYQIIPESIIRSDIDITAWSTLGLTSIIKSNLDTSEFGLNGKLIKSNIDISGFTQVYPTPESIIKSNLDTSNYQIIPLSIIKSNLDTSNYQIIPLSIIRSDIDITAWSTLGLTTIIKSNLDTSELGFNGKLIKSNLDTSGFTQVYPTPESIIKSDLDTTNLLYTSLS